jgi:hypothetical protein
MALNVTTICHEPEYPNAECRFLFNVILSVIMLSVVKLNVVMLSVVAPMRVGSRSILRFSFRFQPSLIFVGKTRSLP